MTIELASKKEQKIVEEALRNPEGSAVFFSLAVGDLELGDYIYDGEWGSDESGAISVDLDVDVRLPRPYDDAPSTYAVHVNGVVIPQMAGLVSLPEINEDKASTGFLAASARAEAGRLRLNDVTEYPGETPEDIVKDAVSRLPYARAYTRIEPLREPLLYFDSAHAAHFWPEETVGDVLSRVEEQTPYKIRDNAYGGVVASPALEPSKVVESFRVYNSDDFLKWRPPPRAERRYSEVVVFRRNEDGQNAFPPAREKIHYPRQFYTPLKEAALWIQLDDLTEQAPQRAKNLASQMAARLGRGTFKETTGAILPFFDPLIEIQDVFWVYEDWQDLKGFWSRSWLCWVDTYKHDFQTLNTEVTYSAALIEEEEIKAPVFAAAGLSGGVVLTVISDCDQIGDDLRFKSLEWTYLEGDELVLSDGAGNVSLDGDEISIVCPYGPTVEAWGEYPHGEIYILDVVSWESQDAGETVIEDTSSDGNALLAGDEIVFTTNVKIPVTLPLWGELPVFEMFFADSVSWAATDGDDVVVEETLSGGNAWVEGEELVIS